MITRETLVVLLPYSFNVYGLWEVREGRGQESMNVRVQDSLQEVHRVVMKEQEYLLLIGKDG